MSNQKGAVSLLIIGIIIAFVTLLIAVFIFRSKLQEKLSFPSAPTQQERDAAKQLPKSQCGCWNGIKNICLPQSDCI